MYFITICCESGRSAFTKIESVGPLIEQLKVASARRQFAVRAYCVVPDHFHALAQSLSEESNMQSFVRYFKQMTSSEYSLRTGKKSGRRSFTIIYFERRIHRRPWLGISG